MREYCFLSHSTCPYWFFAPDRKIGLATNCTHNTSRICVTYFFRIHKYCRRRKVALVRAPWAGLFIAFAKISMSWCPRCYPDLVWGRALWFMSPHLEVSGARCVRRHSPLRNFRIHRFAECCLHGRRLAGTTEFSFRFGPVIPRIRQDLSRSG